MTMLVPGQTIFFPNSQNSNAPFVVKITNEKYGLGDVEKSSLPVKKTPIPVVVNWDYIRFKGQVCCSVTSIRNLEDKPTESKIHELIQKGFIGILTVENQKAVSLQLKANVNQVFNGVGIQTVMFCHPKTKSYGWIDKDIKRIDFTEDEYQHKMRSLPAFLKKNGAID